MDVYSGVFWFCTTPVIVLLLVYVALPMTLCDVDAADRTAEKQTQNTSFNNKPQSPYKYAEQRLKTGEEEVH